MNPSERSYVERKIDELVPVNRALVREFMRVRRIRGVQEASLKSYVAWLRLFDRRTRKLFRDAGAADVLDFLADLKSETEEHTPYPRRHEPHAPLFPTFTRRSPSGRLSPNGISMLLRHLHQRAEIRPVNPHLFRHPRATEAARKNCNETRMRLFFGWTGWSRMPSLYTHLTPDLIRQQVLQDAGFLEATPSPVVRAEADPAKALADALTRLIQRDAPRGTI